VGASGVYQNSARRQQAAQLKYCVITAPSVFRMALWSRSLRQAAHRALQAAVRVFSCGGCRDLI